MLNEGINISDFLGNILPLGYAIFFSGLIIIVRKYYDIDMMATSLIPGVY
tara:strand:+ start:87 stop:236 length:150 start_codon:yes stop_codon:yes gene_type:complete